MRGCQCISNNVPMEKVVVAAHRLGWNDVIINGTSVDYSAVSLFFLVGGEDLFNIIDGVDGLIVR